MDIRAILHHIQQGVSDRRTAEELGVNRRTVQQYRKWAQEQGLLAGPLPPPEQLQALIKQRLPAQLPPQNRSSVAQYQEQIVKLHQQGVEIAAIWARLQGRGIRAATTRSTGWCASWRRRSRKCSCGWNANRAKRRRWTSAM